MDKILAEICKYFKDNAVFLTCITCLVILYDATYLDYRYWLMSILVFLAEKWQYNGR